MGGGFKVGAAYVRVSTVEQTELSPASQLKTIRDYAKNHGYIIPDEYIFQDDGISGKSADKRPAFRLMIATAKEAERPFDAIFVWKFSRFARNQEEAIMYKNLLRKKGVEVVSISEPSNDSPFSSLIERIIEWMDEYYLINLAGEVKRGMKEKASRGEPTGRCAFGYRVENKTLVPTDDAAIVKMIFEQYAAGKGVYSIVTGLNDSGLKIRRKPFAKNSVQYILNNPTYIGKIRWEEDGHLKYNRASYIPALDELPDGKHEPIISMELWDAVQERLRNSRQEIRYARAGHDVYMLKGLCRCSACGNTLVKVTQGPSRAPALQCCGYGRGACRVSHYIPIHNADAAVIAALEMVIASSTFEFTPKQPPKSVQAQDWDKLIAVEKTRLSRAKEAYLGGVLSLEEYAEIKAAADDSITKLEAARDKDSGTAAVDVAAYSARVLQVLDVVRADGVSGEAKNQALRSVIDKIVFNKADNTFDFFFLP